MNGIPLPGTGESVSLDQSGARNGAKVFVGFVIVLAMLIGAERVINMLANQTDQVGEIEVV